MTRSLREQGIYLLAIAFATAPFAFALLRASRTGYDLRPLWMALASLLGACLVATIGKRHSRRPALVLVLSLVTLVTAALLAGSTAFLLGATASPGVWAVAIVFGLCWAANYALLALSRPPAGRAG